MRGIHDINLQASNLHFNLRDYYLVIKGLFLTHAFF